MKSVIVFIGPGAIGQAIARRVSAGKHVLLADVRLENAKARYEAEESEGRKAGDGGAPWAGTPIRRLQGGREGKKGLSHVRPGGTREAPQPQQRRRKNPARPDPFCPES
jgi:NAD(P)-dependent dehydrogenase (short-subunit alcohol dehydrogenase family)